MLMIMMLPLAMACENGILTCDVLEKDAELTLSVAEAVT